MATEIERKFLIKYNEFEKYQKTILHSDKTDMYQLYIINTKNLIIRLRKESNVWTGKQKYILAIKGKTIGMSRKEYEWKLGNKIGKLLMGLFILRPIIQKRRYLYNYKQSNDVTKTWEIDRFFNLDIELWLAEIELKSEDEKIEIPGFIFTEVTNDPRYYNSNLIKRIKMKR